MRVLLVTNSYPSVHSPSGAPYITARVRALRRAGTDLAAVALVPSHTAESRLARRALGLHSNHALALDEHDDGKEFSAASFSWTIADVLSGRLGRVPHRGIDGAVRSVLSAVSSDGGSFPTGRSPSRGFDVVHAHGMYTLPAGEVARRVARELEVPWVVTMHGSDVTSVMPRFTEAWSRTLHEADATVYVSEALREKALSLGAPVEGSVVIPNGFDSDIFTSGTATGAGSAPSLLFVGNLLRVKGADRLPRILAEIRRVIPGATMDVIGDGPLRPALEGVEGLTLHGRLPQGLVASAMRSADVLVVPSRDEGWGCVVTESYACGTPVVASRVGGLRESILTESHLVDVSGSEDDACRSFAVAVSGVVAAPPASEQLVAHSSGRTWGTVAVQELAVLRSVLA